MPLIQAVFEACARLDSLGWRDFLLRVSDLDIRQSTAAALAAELGRPLRRIGRTVPGFTDFALEGKQAIQAGRPSHSLLFHAVAAPGLGVGYVRDFPAPDDIEAIENYVYGVVPPSIADLRSRAAGAPLAIVVYACEYRPAIQTVQRKHADGVARIGTAPPIYVPSARGHVSLGPDARRLHVIPVRYSAYIAAQVLGDVASFGPLLFRQPGVDAEGNPVAPDNTRLFWVPLHKIFSGDECIRGRTLDLTYTTDHRNEKLRRIHGSWSSRVIPHASPARSSTARRSCFPKTSSRRLTAPPAARCASRPSPLHSPPKSSSTAAPSVSTSSPAGPLRRRRFASCPVPAAAASLPNTSMRGRC
jgi:hypothetical protein